MTIKIAAWSAPLLKPSPLKGAKGGRASGKSHRFAEMLLERHQGDPNLRSVCIREIQKSTRFSSYQLIKDKAEKLYPNRFQFVNGEIRDTLGGGIIVFSGMQDHTADSIKSLEGFDIAWFEEAQRASKRSLDLLTPTILRKTGAECWFTWNPENDNDPIELLAKDDDFLLVSCSYLDNPFVDEQVHREAEKMKARDLDAYDHIWLGGYNTKNEAQVFNGYWTVEEFTPADNWTAYQGLDFGFSQDPTAAIRCYVENNKLYIYQEAGKVGLELDDTADYIEARIPNFSKEEIQADSARPESISYLKRKGLPRITGVKKWAGSVEDGIEFIKSLDGVIIHPQCKETIDEFRLYSYKVDKRTDTITSKIEDNHNHYIDACFSGDTLVTVNGKLMRFDQIPEKGFITGFDGEQVSYRNGGYIKTEMIYCITDSNGNKYRSTGDHKFLTDRGWIEAKNLLGERLCESGLFQKESKNSTGKDTIFTAMKSILARALKGFIGLSGSTTTAAYQRGSISTTKTTTRQTTRLKTLKQSRLESIYRSMLKSFIRRILIMRSRTLQRIRISAGLGISPTRERLGIESTTRSMAANSGMRLRGSAGIAEKLTAPMESINCRFAQTLANQHTEESQESMMSREDVSLAAHRLLLTNTQKLPTVVEVVQQSIEPSYCVTVDRGQCFSLPSGAIVSNCRYSLVKFIKKQDFIFM